MYSKVIAKLLFENKLPHSAKGHVPLVSAELLRIIFKQPGNIGGAVVKQLELDGFDVIRVGSITTNMVEFKPGGFTAEEFFPNGIYGGPTGGYAIFPAGTRALMDWRCNPRTVASWPPEIIESAMSLYASHKLNPNRSSQTDQ